MANERILIFEAPWPDDISQTQATREIYSSAQTLLSVSSQPVRIIQRPLLTTYLDDLKLFVNLACNRYGLNIVIFSTHGSYCRVKTGTKRKHRRQLMAFDGEINLSSTIRALEGELSRTLFILDACQTGTEVQSFRKATGALGAIGFSKKVDWIDSSIFVLALMLHFQEKEVFDRERKRTDLEVACSRAKDAVESMVEGTYESLAESLGVEYSFCPSMPVNARSRSARFHLVRV